MSGPPAHIMIRLFQLINHAIVAKRRAACFGDGGGARRELCATDERALVELLITNVETNRFEPIAVALAK